MDELKDVDLNINWERVDYLFIEVATHFFSQE